MKGNRNKESNLLSIIMTDRQIDKSDNWRKGAEGELADAQSERRKRAILQRGYSSGRGRRAETASGHSLWKVTRITSNKGGIL